MTRPTDYPWSRVLCLEGDWFGLAGKTSVRPILEVLEGLEYITFAHRDVATRQELDHYLRSWINDEFDFWTLYLAFHGTDAGLDLSEGSEGDASLAHLGSVMEDSLDHCVVYIASCSVLATDADKIERFLKQTGAEALIGYTEDVDWVDAAAMDLHVLTTLAYYKRLSTVREKLSSQRYAGLRKGLGFRFFPS